MKKILSIITIAGILFLCAGCAADSSESIQTTTVDTTALDRTTETTVQTEADATTSQSITTSTSTQLATTTTTTFATTTTTMTTQEVTTTMAKRMRYYPFYKDFIQLRGGLKNTSYKITEKELSIAFLGGSVTAGMGDSPAGTGGWRGRTMMQLKLTYNCIFKQINAVEGGNGSQFGTYFTQPFVASKNPDLVFIEYAVNNAYDGNTDAQVLWTHYESMIHTIRTANPYADIVLVYVSDQNNSARTIIPELEKIADKYQLPSVNLYEAVQYKIDRNEYPWSKYYSDAVHPGPEGYKVMTEAILGLIENAMQTPSATYEMMKTAEPKVAIKKQANAILTSQLDTVPQGWEKLTSSSSKYGGSIETTEAGKAITVTFTGTDFGVLVTFAEDAGVLEYSVDGGIYEELDCYLNYSNPKARMLLENGQNSKHTIILRLRDNGKRMAIQGFMFNGADLTVQ